MRLLLVERRAWITQRDFIEDWALSRLSPGVHLVALAGLLGRRIRGVAGAAVALLAMMLPAGAISAGLTAGYSTIRDQPLVQAAFAGAGPVTIGLTIGITYVFARAAARPGRDGIPEWVLLAACAAAGVLFPGSPLPVIAGGAVIGAIFLGRDRKPPPELPMD